MTYGDLPDVARWRAAEHVQKWWSDDGEATLEAVTAKYGPDIDGTTPTRMWVAEANGRSVGFVQDYRIGDYPEYAVLGPDPAAIGIDYAIGDVAWTGRGIGTRFVWAWMQRARHRFPEATAYFAAPDHRNRAPCGCWPSWDSPRVSGSTSRRRTARVDTVVGCTLDVLRVLG